MTVNTVTHNMLLGKDGLAVYVNDTVNGKLSSIFTA